MIAIDRRSRYSLDPASDASVATAGIAAVGVDDRSRTAIAPGTSRGPGIGRSPTAPGVNAMPNAVTSPGADDFDLNKPLAAEETEARHISDEEPTLTAEQQKDLFTKCLNNRFGVRLRSRADGNEDAEEDDLTIVALGRSKSRNCSRWASPLIRSMSMETRACMLHASAARSVW